MAGMPALGGNILTGQETTIRLWTKMSTRPAGIPRRKGCRVNPVRYL